MGYRTIAEPDLLVCSLGVSLSNKMSPKAIDISCLELSEFHSNTRHQLSKIASAWASIARSGTRLITVLRLGGIEVFLGAMDGIVSSGWLPDYAGFRSVECADGQKFPLLHFNYSPGIPFDCGSAIDWWINQHARTSSCKGEFEGDRALEQVLLYKRSPHHRVHSYATLNGKPTIGIEQGLVDQLFYILIRSTDGHTYARNWANVPNQMAVDSLIAEKLNISVSALKNLRTP